MSLVHVRRKAWCQRSSVVSGTQDGWWSADTGPGVSGRADAGACMFDLRMWQQIKHGIGKAGMKSGPGVRVLRGSQGWFRLRRCACMRVCVCGSLLTVWPTVACLPLPHVCK